MPTHNKKENRVRQVKGVSDLSKISTEENNDFTNAFQRKTQIFIDIKINIGKSNENTISI